VLAKHLLPPQMAVSHPSDEMALIAALHEGPFEDSPWHTFLENLRLAFASDYSGIIFRPPDRMGESPVELFSGDDATPELHRLYRERYAPFDPVMGTHLDEGRVYGLDELFDEDNRDHRAYREAILIPRGIRFLRSVRIVEPGGVEGWLLIARQDKDFEPFHNAMLERTAAQFRLSLRTYMALENQRAHAWIVDEAIGRLNFGWISLDNQGVVIEINPKARQILDATHSLRITREGRLAGQRGDVDKRLRHAVARLIEGHGKTPQVVNISDDPWLTMLMTSVSANASKAGRTPVLTAFLQSDRKSQADRHEQIASLFGLLPSEARLAVAISQGASIAQAAEMQSISVETARSYSKSVYAKMGARGQADVVRFILTSVIALA